MPPSLREELENLTLSQLEAIWQQEAAYEMFFYNTSAVKELSRATEEVEWNVISDEDIAQCDESKASLHGLQTDVARLLQGLDRKVASISSSQERRRQTLHRLKPQDVMRRMDESTAQKEAESEATLTAFTDGTLALNDFIARYTKERKAVHIAAHKAQHGAEAAAQLTSSIHA